MDKALIDKYKNDPAWAETIKLYSGLFDSQEKREDFISNIADSNVLLAAQCKSNSIDSEITLCNNIEKKIEYDETSSEREIANGWLTLIELDKSEKLRNNIAQYKKKHSKLPNIIDRLVDNQSNENVFEFYSVLASLHERLSSKEKRRLREILQKLKDINQDIQFFINKLIAISSPSNITEIRKIIEEVGINKNKSKDSKSIVASIDSLIKQNKPLSIKQAILLVHQYELKEHFDIIKLIQKLINFKTSFALKHSSILIQKLNLENDFQKLNTITENKTNIKNECTEKLICCTITNIIPTRVFVKIKGDERLASIYIGDLDNKRIEDIFGFKYKGTPLHQGQELFVKIKNIDNQNRINLSMKDIKD
jgi:hypothetical protein